jgi:L,D-transpeptidase ErfK/SrfK
MRTSRYLLTALPLLLSGCATWDGFFDKGEAPAMQTVIEHAERPLAEPINRNFFVLESPAQSVIGELQVVRIGEGESFPDLAREYGLGYDELLSANPGIDPWIPETGTPVLLPTQYVLPDAPREGVVLNIATKRLFYYPPAAEGEPQQVMSYPIGIGRVGWETPLGETKVTAKARDPHWYVPASVRKEHAELGDPLPSIVPPGPDNPLGRFVLKLGLPGYLIHGTNQPYGVGMRVSHGCVRLYPENIEMLYSLVDIGVPVTIVNQPHLLGVRGEQLYFESHPALEEDEVELAEHLAALQKKLASQKYTGASDEHINAQMRAVASEARGVPVQIAKGDLDEIYERAILVRNTVELDPDAPTLAEVRELIDQLPPASEEVVKAIN